MTMNGADEGGLMELSRRRVKLYTLSDDRVWEDQGTGHVTYSYVNASKLTSLIVRSEIDGSTLLDSKVLLDTAYQKQQETLIVWSEGEDKDFALSFQDRAGCDEIWEKICQVQGKDPSLDVTQEIADEDEEDDPYSAAAADADADGDLVSSTTMTNVSHALTLPACELSRLPEITQLFTTMLSSAPIRCDRLATAIVRDNYIRQLIDLFHCCEDLDDVDGLHQLYAIFKSIFMLNKTTLLETLFSTDIIMDVVGVLEYDPMLSEPVLHREFLTTGSKLRQVIPLKNTQLVDKIQQTYRVQYIHDVILPTPSIFEDNLLSTLTSFIYFNKMDIVTLLQADESFLQSLFSALNDEDITDTADDIADADDDPGDDKTGNDDGKECDAGGDNAIDDNDDAEEDDNSSTKLVRRRSGRRRDVAQFLKEFCQFSQTLAAQNRDTFFKTLSSHGLFTALKAMMKSPDNLLQSVGLDILTIVVEFNPSMVRDFILLDAQQQQQNDADLMMNVLIKMLNSSADPVLVSTVIRLLVDPDNMINTSATTSPLCVTAVKRATLHERNHKTSFLSLFYSRCISFLASFLLDITTDSQGQPAPDDSVTSETLTVVLDLLTFCVEHHTYHCKNFVMMRNIGRCVLTLLKSRHAFLSLSALRFLRRMISLKDDFYNRYVVKYDLLRPVVDAFVANGLTKYNLFNSAVIELFEFIHTESLSTLIKYFVDTHYSSIESVTYVETFSKLKQQREQLQRQQEQRLAENSRSGQSSVGRHRFVLGRMKRTHAEFWFDDNATEDNDPDNNDNSDNDSTDNSDGGDGVVPEHPMMQLLKTRLDFLDDDDEDTVASGDNFPTDVGCASDAQCKLSASSTSSSVLASTSSSSLLDSTATGSALHEPMDEEDDNGANIPDSSDTSTSLDRVCESEGDVKRRRCHHRRRHPHHKHHRRLQQRQTDSTSSSPKSISASCQPQQTSHTTSTRPSAKTLIVSSAICDLQLSRDPNSISISAYVKQLETSSPRVSCQQPASHNSDSVNSDSVSSQQEQAASVTNSGGSSPLSVSSHQQLGATHMSSISEQCSTDSLGGGQSDCTDITVDADTDVDMTSVSAM